MSFSHYVLFPLKQSHRVVDTVSAVLTAELSVNTALRRVETMEPSGSFFLHCVIVGQQSMCLPCAHCFFGGLHSRLSFFRGEEKNKFKSRLSHPRGIYPVVNYGDNH